MQQNAGFMHSLVPSYNNTKAHIGADSAALFPQMLALALCDGEMQFLFSETKHCTLTVGVWSSKEI